MTSHIPKQAQEKMEELWAKAWYEHLQSDDESAPMIKTHFYKALRIGYLEGVKQERERAEILINAIKSTIGYEPFEPSLDPYRLSNALATYLKQAGDE